MCCAFSHSSSAVLCPTSIRPRAEAHISGTPSMRPMMLEFPADPACTTLDRQYMLGESLLVAPVLSFDGTVEYYVPSGNWTNFITGEVVKGGQWLAGRYDFMSLPLLVRPNSAIVVGDEDTKPDYEYAGNFTLRVYRLSHGSQAIAEIPTSDGAVAVRFKVSRSGDSICVDWAGDPKEWKLSVGRIGSRRQSRRWFVSDRGKRTRSDTR